MRFTELHFHAFGPFTDLHLPLSTNHQAVNIFYGRNEAGKSSALRGLRALLFGIPQQCTDNFLHDYDKLRLGGRIRRSDGLELSFVRRKRLKRTLLAQDGSLLPDDALAPFLQGLTEQFFSTFFAMNHAELLRGGKEILAGKGELGSTLFSAAIGGAQLRQVIEGLEREAHDLFAPRGQNQTVNKAVQGYDEAKRAMRDASLSSDKWIAHARSLEAATTHRHEVRSQLLACRTECDRLERIQNLLPKLAERERLLERQKPLYGVPLLRHDFSEDRRGARRQLEEARSSERQNSSEVVRLKTENEKLQVNNNLILQAQAVHDLHRRLGSFQKAESDLPGLFARRRQAEEDVAALLRDLDLDINLGDFHSFRPALPKRARLAEMASKGENLINAIESADKLVALLAAEHARLAVEKDGLALPRHIGMIEKALQNAQSQGRLEEDLAKTTASIAAAEEQCNVESGRIGLWKGTLEELEALPVPDEETRALFESEFLDLQMKRKNVVERASKRAAEVFDLNRKLEDLRLLGDVVTPADLGAARKRRDQGWQIIRCAWLEGMDVTTRAKAYDSEQDLPLAYESSVVRADETSDRLRREAERVGLYTSMLAQWNAASKDLNNLTEEQKKLQQEEFDVQARWHAAWPSKVSPLTPKEMCSWLIQYKKICGLAEKLRSYRADQKGLEQIISTHRAVLRGALESIGENASPTATLEGLIVHAREVVRQIEDVERKRQDLEEKLDSLCKEKNNAEAEQRTAQRRLEKWQEEWTTVLKGLRMSEGSMPSEVIVVLDRLESIGKKIDEGAAYANRIEAIEKDAEGFRKSVRDLIHCLELDLSGLSEQQAAEEMHTRLAEAQKDAVRREEILRQLRNREEQLGQAKEKISLSEERLDLPPFVTPGPMKLTPVLRGTCFDDY